MNINTSISYDFEAKENKNSINMENLEKNEEGRRKREQAYMEKVLLNLHKNRSEQK